MKQSYMLVIAFGITSILLGCGASDEKNGSVSKSKVRTKTANQVFANRIMQADVEGMVCKMGCGASIRKELLATDAVESCEIDFQEKRKSNQIKVAFDKDKITVDKLVSIINTMNDKQFKVGNVETQEFESQKVIEEETSGSKGNEESKLKLEEASFETPNLLHLFSRLITG